MYVILDDINDNCPMFTQTGIYTGSVIETADIGDQVLELYAEDFDDGINRRIKFTIDRSSMRPPGECFRQSGWSLLCCINYEHLR